MFDPIEFRNAMGHFATGVTVVTVSDGAGGVGGLTANAFSSLSLDPPLVLVCVDQLSQALAYLTAEKTFTLHFLAADQEQTALAFAQRGPDKANGIDWHLNTRGVPALDDYLVALDCDLENAVPGGDHTIIIGRVLDIKMSDAERQPLTYYKGMMNGLG